MPLKYFSQGYFKAKYFWRGIIDDVVEVLRRSLRTFVVTFQNVRSLFATEKETAYTGSVVATSVTLENVDGVVTPTSLSTSYIRRPR